ncbi:MAG: hypothetical protein NZ902_06630 [Acidilobaceae archaeon]|nr:hypothetical protein [Acidilobaceae archaeon]
MRSPSPNPRRKGKGFEYEVVEFFRSCGLNASRVPLSGSAPLLKGDVVVELPTGTLLVECKRRKKLADFLQLKHGISAVAIREDRGELRFLVSSDLMKMLLEAGNVRGEEVR